jgi:hypothetical protein
VVENVQHIGRLLFGILDWRRVLVIIAPGIMMGGVTWLIYDGALWQRIIVVLLMVDLVAGATSNATLQTNAAWRLLTRWLCGSACVCVSGGVVAVDSTARIIVGDDNHTSNQTFAVCAWRIVESCLISWNKNPTITYNTIR